MSLGDHGLKSVVRTGAANSLAVQCDPEARGVALQGAAIGPPAPFEPRTEIPGHADATALMKNSLGAAAPSRQHGRPRPDIPRLCPTHPEEATMFRPTRTAAAALTLAATLALPLLAQETPRYAGPTDRGFLLPNGWTI